MSVPTPPGQDRPSDPQQSEPPRSDYPALLEGFSGFVSAYCDAVLAATADDPEVHPTLQVLAASARTSAGATAAELRRMYDESGEATRASVERQLRISGGMSLIEAARVVVTTPGTITTPGVAAVINPGAGATNRSALGWLALIIHLLKKLIALLFPHIPRWLQNVLDFIDEIIEMLQHLLGGKDASRFGHEMAERWLNTQRLINQVEASAKPMTEAGES